MGIVSQKYVTILHSILRAKLISFISIHFIKIAIMLKYNNNGNNFSKYEKILWTLSIKLLQHLWWPILYKCHFKYKKECEVFCCWSNSNISLF